MTAFDRIESRLPELFDELAAATVPDYFDDMLQQATRSRQRPAWSAPERWLPMGVLARPIPTRPLPWRLIALAAAIALLAAATLVYVGSRTRVPPPFGLAANGVLLAGTADGDIVAVDPRTGTPTPLLTGPTRDGGPFFSNDGRRFVFDRAATTDASPVLFIANADGSDARELLPSVTALSWLDWSPSGDRIVVVQKAAGQGSISIVSIVDRQTVEVPFGGDVVAASWRPGHEQLIVTEATGGTRRFWVIDEDGSDKRPIVASEYAINAPALSPDGTRLAYTTWEPVIEGRLRIVDIDAGRDRTLTPDEQDGFVWQSPQFSPDGRDILLNRFPAGSDPVTAQLALIAADGTGQPRVFGPSNENPQPDVSYSPDGTTIVAVYSAKQTILLFGADGSGGQPAPFVAAGGLTWQRVAP